jgi:hypothetical protein
MESKEYSLTGIGDGGPPVNAELKPDNVACARHMEPFAETWPKGYEQFAISLFETLINDAQFMEGIDPENIGLLLDRQPMCERVSDSDLRMAYLSSTVLHDGTCEVCSTVGAGTSYRNARPGGEVITYNHLCLDCMLTRFRPLN